MVTEFINYSFLTQPSRNNLALSSTQTSADGLVLQHKSPDGSVAYHAIIMRLSDQLYWLLYRLLPLMTLTSWSQAHQ